MTLEELKSKIVFRERPDFNGTVTFIASLEFHAIQCYDPKVLDPSDKIVIQWVKEDLAERLLKHIYEDRRKEMAEAIQDIIALLSNPHSSSFSHAIERLMLAARYQPPETQKPPIAQEPVTDG